MVSVKELAVVAVFQFVQVPSTDSSRARTLVAMPEAASEKFVLLTDQPDEPELAVDHAPAAVPLVLLAVSAPPVGAVVSEAKDTVPIPVFPAESRPVTV